MSLICPLHSALSQKKCTNLKRYTSANISHHIMKKTWALAPVQMGEVKNLEMSESAKSLDANEGRVYS